MNTPGGNRLDQPSRTHESRSGSEGTMGGSGNDDADRPVAPSHELARTASSRPRPAGSPDDADGRWWVHLTNARGVEVTVAISPSSPGWGRPASAAGPDDPDRDRKTLDAACRLMPRLDRDLIARTLQLGRYRPGTASSPEK